jgi:xylulokinase
MFVGIDVGTSEVKALLLSDSHVVVGSAGSPLDVQRPHAGHSEQHPDAWWAATLAALTALREAFPVEYAGVRAIGLSGQMHGAVLVDERDQVLRPAILWNDTRSAQQCSDMMTEMPELSMIGGSLAMPGFTAPKLRWVAKHEPEIFKRIAKVLLPKDYIRLKLTGHYVSDMSDASGTLWLDVKKRSWSKELLALCELDTRHMPRLVEGCEPSANLRSDVASELSLNPNVVVAGGAGDNAASAVAMGLVSPSKGFLSLGTSGVLFVVTPNYQPNPESATHAFCHSVPGAWHQMSVMLSAASCVQWAKNLVGDSTEAIFAKRAEALSLSARASAPIFLPYLSGERTPHNSADLRGSFHRLSFDTNADMLAYCVLEGVTFGLCDGMNALKTAGNSVEQLWLVGGGARSEYWAQQLASALDIQIMIAGGAALGGAMGAARLGWLASIENQHSAAARDAELATVCPVPIAQARFNPNPAEQSLLWERLASFRSIYQRHAHHTK